MELLYIRFDYGFLKFYYGTFLFFMGSKRLHRNLFQRAPERRSPFTITYFHIYPHLLHWTAAARVRHLVLQIRTNRSRYFSEFAVDVDLVSGTVPKMSRIHLPSFGIRKLVRRRRNYPM